MRKFNPTGLTPVKNSKYDLIEKIWSQFDHFHLEIGAGVGWHPIQFAKENPRTLVIAVERTSDKFASFSRRLGNHDLKNIVAIHADVVPWLWHFDHKYKFDKIWLLYPNPEPKNKNQRWINSPFFSHLLERLKADGEIEMATNIDSYASEVAEKSRDYWSLQCQRSLHLGSPRTHFEKKYQERHALVLKRCQ